jgi:hypothetical protein
MRPGSHCEKRSDEAIQSRLPSITAGGSGLLRSARNDVRKYYGLLILLGAFALAGPPASAQAEPPSACSYLSSLIPVDGGPLFLPSYPTAEDGPLRSVAFLYDDAVAAIALVGCGESGRARRIGDAMLAALDHDRAWHDGRLRNAYAAGPVHDFPVKLGGWWDKVQNRWLEDGYQVGSDSGNMAWAMLALLSLDGAQHDPRYRDGAVRIGNWVAGHGDTRGAGGFTGGMSGWELAPKPLAWKSTEHNTDLAAAFALLSRRTGDPVWSDRARHAAAFVSAMWDEGCACFAVGTAEDGVTPNRILAVGAGYSYSDAALGMWTEGTAQAALVAGLLGHGDAAASLSAAVAAQRAPHGGYFATGGAALATGFADPTDSKAQRFYYHMPHLAAAAWAALAEKGFNPFTLSAALP